MTDTLKGATIKRPTEAQILAVVVSAITFPNLAQGAEPVAGDTGTVVVATVPQTPYIVGDLLRWDRGMNFNKIDFTVTSVVGPAKYQLRTQ